MNALKRNSNNDLGVVNKKLYVKYMVCLRDKMTVQSELVKLGLTYRITAHGAIEFLEEITNVQFNELKTSLSKTGLFLLDEKESMLIDRIISTIVDVIHHTDKLPRLNFEDIITQQKVLLSESVLKVFSDVTGMSVLQFIVIQKIERAKDLLIYEDLSLSEIADSLNYKNQDYLVAQFKKITGLAPSYFEQLKKERRRLSSIKLKKKQPGVPQNKERAAS
jgi:AraC-like DNA-binding protein